MFTTCQPSDRNHRDSARVEKRGPGITTTVPSVVHAHADALARLDRVPGDDCAVRIGVGDVMGVARVVVRVGATPGAIDELVEDDEVAGMDVGRQRSRRARADHLAHAEHAHRPEIGAGGDARRRELVVAPVAGNERDAAAADLGDRYGRARGPERRVEDDLFDRGGRSVPAPKL